jgi:hypothetical protein
MFANGQIYRAGGFRMANPRISARKGAVVRLNASFYQNGVLADPFAIRRINIYRGSKSTENLVVQIPLPSPGGGNYPSPVEQEQDSSGPLVGRYFYDFLVPDDFTAPSIYIDEWEFIGDHLIVGADGTVDEVDITDVTGDDDSAPFFQGNDADINDEQLWDSQCNRFWVFPSNDWYVDDGLIAARFGFEPLDRHFSKPEIRPLEIGIMPLPRYDFDYNRVAPLIPRLISTIDIETLNSELIYEAQPCTMAIRQGSFRTNPFVVRYLLDTSTFLMGTYRYRITVRLPNGETRVSPNLVFTIQ